MQTQYDANLQKQFEFAEGEFKLLSNSLNYKVASNCLPAIHIRFAMIEFISGTHNIKAGWFNDLVSE